MIAGNTTYTFGVHNKSAGQLMVGRALCGTGSCILVIGYAHVTRYSRLASRESRVLYFRFVIALGTIIGPLIGTIVGGGSVSLKFLSIEANNSGSFVVATISGLYLLSMLFYILLHHRKEEQKVEDRALWGRTESESRQIDEQYGQLDHDIKNYVWRPHRFCSAEALMLWFLNTTAVFAFWSFIGAIIPVGASQGANDMTQREIYAVFVYVGICYLASFGLNKFAFKFFNIQMEKRVFVALILMTFGSVFLTAFGVNDDNGKNIYSWQFIVATPFLSAGYCICTINIPALYVQLMGADKGGLGLRMSWFFSLSSFGLMAGPIYGFLVWKQFGSVNFISHTSSLILLVALLVGFVMISTSQSSQDPTVRTSQEFQMEQYKGSTKNEDELKQGLLMDRL